MMRKITLLFLLFFGLQPIVKAATLDSVTIYLAPYTDTTCPGTQLNFTAIQSDTSFHGVTYQWYTNGAPTAVVIDSFHTTALNDGDSVYCILHYTNSSGPATAISNVIYIYRRSAIPPRVVTSIVSGSNPDCAGHTLKFKAYPINGGSAPVYQWKINGVDVFGATTDTLSGIFGGTDTISCMMISNSPCRTFDTAYSGKIPIIHIHLTSGISIVATLNPICQGRLDTFTATLSNPGASYSMSWFVNGNRIPAALGNTYITDSLTNGSLVYCVLYSADSCIINDTANSNVLNMTVIPNSITSVISVLTGGSNPGCYDSLVTFTAIETGFGTAPAYTWFVNGVPRASTPVFSSLFIDGDVVSLKVKQTDGGCYTDDSITIPSYLMIRDSTPVTPLVSLIGNMLVANTFGIYRWYYNSYRSYTGSTLIAGVNGRSFHPTTLGYYYSILDTGNCPSEPSNIIYISLLNVNNLTTGNVNIYPNPTTGILNFDWDNSPVDMKIDVYSMTGQGLLHDEIKGKSHHQIDISYLPEGNYFVKLREQDGSSGTYKITITK